MLRCHILRCALFVARKNSRGFAKVLLIFACVYAAWGFMFVTLITNVLINGNGFWTVISAASVVHMICLYAHAAIITLASIYLAKSKNSEEGVNHEPAITESAPLNKKYDMLKQMKDDGAITAEEFKKRATELADKM